MTSYKNQVCQEVQKVWDEYPIAGDELVDICRLAGQLVSLGTNVDVIRRWFGEQIESKAYTNANPTPWDKQAAVDLSLDTKVRIDGKVWVFNGFTLQVYTHEWDQLDLEFGDDEDDPDSFRVETLEAPDETVNTTTTEEFKDGKRVRVVTSKMTATATRPSRSGKLVVE